MAKQGEMRVKSEREVWKIPYYDLGDVTDNVDTRTHIRTTEGSNVLEFASFAAEVCSHPRLGFNDFGINNDTVPTLYDSIFFNQSDIIWQNIRKKRDGTDLFYNRLQHYGYVNADVVQWISPWVVVGLGSKDGEPGYYIEVPSHSDDTRTDTDGHLNDDLGDDYYNIDMNKSTSTICSSYYDDSWGDYVLRLFSYVGFYDEWTVTTSTYAEELSISRANNYQLYEEVTMDLGNWVSLNNSNLAQYTEAVDERQTLADQTSSYHIDEGYDQGHRERRYSNVDYDIDYANGQIKALSDGDINDGEVCFVHYQYGNELKVYIVMEDGLDYDLEQRSFIDGSVDWTITFTDSVDALIGGSDGVYVRTYGSKDIEKYDRTGSLAWTNSNATDYTDFFDLDNNENYLYFASDDYVGRIDLSTQNIDWEKSMGGDYVNAMQLDYDDSFLYVSYKSPDQILEINPSDGSILRTYSTYADNITVPPPGDTQDPLDFVNKL